MTTPSTEFYRFDPLTGCNNFLGFLEALDLLASDEKKQAISILYTDLNHMQMLNQTKGRPYGDSVLRWLAIVLQEGTEAAVYRLGGDEFAVILADGIRSFHQEQLKRIFERLNREGEQLGMPAPVARISLIHYDDDADVSPTNIMFQLTEAMLEVKTNQNRSISIFMAKDLMGAEANPQEAENKTCRTLRWIANSALQSVFQISRRLDEAQKDSYFDSISGLPNMRAALLKLDKAITEATAAKQAFAILLIDGDNLRLYNNISYAAGDEMIQCMGKVLSECLRPGDFIARWRTGDELIVILPNTTDEGAKVVGERFCLAIREASKNWTFPTTISIGIAVYPKHGDQVNALVDVAESANKRAKDAGKDRVILANYDEMKLAVV